MLSFLFSFLCAARGLCVHVLVTLKADHHIAFIDGFAVQKGIDHPEQKVAEKIILQKYGVLGEKTDLKKERRRTKYGGQKARAERMRAELWNVGFLCHLINAHKEEPEEEKATYEGEHGKHRNKHRIRLPKPNQLEKGNKEGKTADHLSSKLPN